MQFGGHYFPVFPISISEIGHLLDIDYFRRTYVDLDTITAQGYGTRAVKLVSRSCESISHWINNSYIVVRSNENRLFIVSYYRTEKLTHKISILHNLVRSFIMGYIGNFKFYYEDKANKSAVGCESTSNCLRVECSGTLPTGVLRFSLFSFKNYSISRTPLRRFWFSNTLSLKSFTSTFFILMAL